MALTEKMKSFCREYLKQKNAVNAYMTAYNSNSYAAASVESGILLKRDDIQEFIATLEKPLNDNAISDRQKKLDIIWEELNNAREQNDHNAIARYLDILNKMQGEYTTTTHNINDNKTVISGLDTNTLQQLIKPKKD